MRKGFSLVELMIVVAIIGILAAIAIPNFVAMQLKAKRSEVPGNVDGIKTAEAAYEASYDTYVDAATAPRTLAGAAADKNSIAWTTTTGFTTIGWSPDGNVRGSYGVATTASATTCGSVTTASTPDFCVTGRSNVDGDAVQAQYNSSKNNNTTITAGHEGLY